jgi:hypothetical protein
MAMQEIGVYHRLPAEQRQLSAGGSRRHISTVARRVAARGTPGYSPLCMPMQRLLKTLQT